LQPRYFCGHRYMTQQELDLFQFASRIVTESSARPPEIVWRELGNSWPLRVLLDDVPDYFFRDLRSPNSSFATNAPEDFAVGALRYHQPVINGVLYPIWHWDRTDVPVFSYQVMHPWRARIMIRTRADHESSVSTPVKGPPWTLDEVDLAI